MAARRAEEIFLHDLDVTVDREAPSAEDAAARIQSEIDAEARAVVQLDRLRASFEQEGDAVNLLWLDHARQGITDLGEMARLTGRKVEEFYAATRRRPTHMKRILASAPVAPVVPNKREA